MRAVVIKDMFCRGSILCCALLLCCLCLWPAGARALSSDAARACVVEAGGAVDNADAACFEQLVDMDAILNEAVDLFMKEAAKPENSSLLPPMLALMFSGAAMAEDNGLGVRKLLVSEARALVHNGIASGAFAGKSVQDYRTEGWVAPLFESVSMGRKEIRNVGTPVRQGKDWIVPFVLRDHGNGNSYAVRARVSDAGGNPRVVAVEKELDRTLRARPGRGEPAPAVRHSGQGGPGAGKLGASGGVGPGLEGSGAREAQAGQSPSCGAGQARAPSRTARRGLASLPFLKAK